MKKDRALLSEL
jgi:hypothetical protein